MLKVGGRRAIGEVAWMMRNRSASRSSRLIVLMYHSISAQTINDPRQLTTSRALFANQLEWIRSAGLRVVSLREGLRQLSDQCPAETLIALTFDDGYLDTYANAFPLLQQFGYLATVFLVPTAIGRSRADFAPPALGPFMDWHHAREMQRYGIAFESHGQTHRKLTQLRSEQIESEMRDSKRAIEDALSASVNGFCYPYGSYDSFTPEIERLGLAQGYSYLATSLAGANTDASDRTRVKRLRISWVDHSRHEIEKECAGSYDWYRGYQWLTGRRTRRLP